IFFFFSSRRRHTRFSRDWSSDVCSSDLSWRSTRELTPLTRDHRHGEARDAHQLARLVLDPDRPDVAAPAKRLGASGGVDPAVERSEERRVGKAWQARGAGEDWMYSRGD